MGREFLDAASPMQPSRYFFPISSGRNAFGEYRVKYSIMIPVKHGMPYLMFAVRSALAQECSELEVIVSVEEYENDALAYLKGENDRRLRIITPPPSLSMAEHWDWVQTHAVGNWQMFVGQDDGLQEDFLETADRLIERAEALGIRTISSQRAYLHWPGSTYDHTGRGRVERGCKSKISVQSIRGEAIKALTGFKSYFDLPQMYTHSMFHRDLISECRNLQGGALFTCHPQDANLAALAVARETSFLYSGVPLGWSGNSDRSAGMAVLSISGKGADSKTAEKIGTEYVSRVNGSKILYPEWAGDFAIGDLNLYFWQALRQTEVLQNDRFVSEITGDEFTSRLFSRIVANQISSGRVWARRRVSELVGRQYPSARIRPVLVGKFLLADFVKKHSGSLLRLFLRTASARLRVAGFRNEVCPANNPWDYPFSDGKTPLGKSNCYLKFRVNGNLGSGSL